MLTYKKGSRGGRTKTGHESCWRMGHCRWGNCCSGYRSRLGCISIRRIQKIIKSGASRFQMLLGSRSQRENNRHWKRVINAARASAATISCPGRAAPVTIRQINCLHRPGTPPRSSFSLAHAHRIRQIPHRCRQNEQDSSLPAQRRTGH